MAKVAILGRTQMLLDTATQLRLAGHELVLVATNPASEQPTGYDVASGAFEELARDAGCSFLSCNRLDPLQHLAIFQRSGADVGVSVNWRTIIPTAFTEAFPLGILNAHGGDLPRYRGNACQAWAILNGEDHVGLCVHRMVGGELDSGDIIARDRLPIGLTIKVGEILGWMGRRTPALFVEALERLTHDSAYVLEVQSRDMADALRCYPRAPKDGRLDWRRAAADVVRLVNASGKPYAGAFFQFRGRKVVVWDASVVEDGERFCAVPGQITALRPDCLEVACGAGKVRLASLEIDGRAVVPLELTRSVRERLE